MINGFDLEGYLQFKGARPVQRDEWVLQCPICEKLKLAVNITKKRWHCWICETYQARSDGSRVATKGAGGIVALIMLLENCTRERAEAWLSWYGWRGQSLGGVSQIDGDLIEDFRISDGSRPLPEIAYPPYTRSLGGGNLPYCQKRGIMAEDVQQFGLAYCEAGRYGGRLLFPVFEFQRLVYFQARATWDPQPGEPYVKALNPPVHSGGAGAKDVLLNLDVARNFRRVAVVEGPVDAIHTGPSAVATFGKHISPAQTMKLRQAGVRALDLMWDGPGPTEPMGAWPEMMKASRQLAGLFDVRLVFLPRGDPGEYHRGELEWFRRYHARPAESVSGLAYL
jgi:hypothetical protein